MKPVLSFIAPAFLMLSASAFAVAPAFAGFQWVPPKSSATVLPSERVVIDEMRVQPQDMINHIRSGSPLPQEPEIFDAPDAAASSMQPVSPAPLATEQNGGMSPIPPIVADPIPLQPTAPQPAPDTLAQPHIQPAPQPQADLHVQSPRPQPQPQSRPQPAQPSANNVVPAPATASPTPLSQVERAQPSSPVPMPNHKMSAAPVAAPSQAQESFSPAPKPAPIAQDIASIPAAALDDSQVVVGFGDSLPLALALGEIVPAGYTYAFSSEVNPGVPVSWDGQGRRWDVVLNDMLAPHGLGVHVRGKTAMVSSARVAHATVSHSAPQNTPAPVDLAPPARQQQPAATPMPAASLPDQRDAVKSAPTTTPAAQPKTPPSASALEAHMRVQQSAPASSPIRTKQPTTRQDLTVLPRGSEPFSDNYEPIVLTPSGSY